MKLTRHNGRSGKHGTYNPRHNDRRFDVENSEHIDAERARQNVYWDCYRTRFFPSSMSFMRNLSAASVPISTSWTGRSIWTRGRPTSMSGTSLTVRTATGNCVPSRKRRWKNWASLSQTLRSPKAGTTTASRPLMRFAGRFCLTSPDGMGYIWIRSRPTAGGTIWKNRIIS